MFRLPQLLDMKVFVDTDSDERLVRRLRRDIAERGRELDGVLKQYFKFVKPAFDYYIAPSMVRVFSHCNFKVLTMAIYFLCYYHNFQTLIHMKIVV